MEKLLLTLKKISTPKRPRSSHGTDSVFRFLDLPAELRNRIYEYALISPSSLLIPSACEHGDISSARQPALTRINRQMRQETLAMFYSQNTFAYHVHRCDFDFMFEWMDSIGLDNRSMIQRVQLILKDRWTCGVGLLDFLRWCTKSTGTDDMWLEYSAHDWQMEHFTKMDEEDRAFAAQARENISSCMAANADLLTEAVDLAKKLAERGGAKEGQIRRAWTKKLQELRMECRCGSRSCNGSREGMSCRCAFEGYCTVRWKHVGIAKQTVLAQGCPQRRSSSFMTD